MSESTEHRRARRRARALQARRGRRFAYGRGPLCGHSACAQNYIDTGERVCVAPKDGG